MKNIAACLYVSPVDPSTLERLVADGKTAQKIAARARKALDQVRAGTLLMSRKIGLSLRVFLDARAAPNRDRGERRTLRLYAVRASRQL